MFELTVFLGLLATGYFVGSAREKKHFSELIIREKDLLSKIPYRSDPGPILSTGETFLVCSSVVIASDFFKNFVGNLRNFFGGRMTTHESLLDRARREAVCRLREKAQAKGASEIVNVRIETAFLDQLGIEISAFGTAIKR